MTTRRTLVLFSVIVALASVSPIGQTQSFDVLIRGGQIAHAHADVFLTKPGRALLGLGAKSAKKE